LITRRDDAGRAALIGFVEARAPRWVVIERSRYIENLPLIAALREWAREHGELAASIAGEDERWTFAAPLDYQDVPSFFARLARATAFGPRVEIWRVTR
jgi:hypothetical protein